MSRGPNRASIIWQIVLKDLREFSRDRLWMVLTPMSLAMVILTFWVLPDRVNETIKMGVYPPDMAKVMSAMGEAGKEQAKAAGKGRSAKAAQGFTVVSFDTEKALKSAVSGESDSDKAKDVALGIAFPADFAKTFGSQQSGKVTLYVAADIPKALRAAVASQIRELAYASQAIAQGKNPLTAFPVSMPDPQTMVLGEDRAGKQVPMRDKMRPLLLLIILMIEALALAGLVATEIEQRTATALLVTPTRTSDLLAAKGLTGTLLGLANGLLFVVASASFGQNVLLVLVLILFGALLASAVGMLTGSAGKDFMSTLFLGVLFLVPLMVPAIATIFPGSPSLWVKVMPSYGLTEAMIGGLGYGRGWAELLPHLATTGAWILGLFAVALLVLKRKVEQL